MRNRAPFIFALSLLLSGFMLEAVAQSTHGCNVADISKYGEFNRAGEDIETGMIFYSVTPTVDTTMTDYVRDSRGQWPLDLKSTTPSSINLQLDTPSGPYRVSLEITINDIPFREHQEKGIETAIAASSMNVSDKRIAPKPVALETVATEPVSEIEESAETSDTQIKATSYRRSDVSKKLAGYLRSQESANNFSGDDEELQWMVSQWLPGGRVLLASPRFGLQHQRVSSLQRLIGEGDLVISTAEIEQAATVVSNADRDGDAIVTSAEIELAGSTKPSAKLWPTGTLLRQSDEGHQSDLTLKVLLHPDKAVCVTTTQNEQEAAKFDSDRLIHEMPFGQLIVVPVRDKRTDGSALQSGQFSIGAMLLPDPLLTHIDSRVDGKLDTREVMQIENRLRLLDRNKDNEITVDEIPLQIMLVVSQGPWANRLLSQLGDQAVEEIVAPKAEAPRWFAGMDTNRDGLLARAEFLGSDDQFAKRDTDSDGVVSAEEAAKGTDK